jgi:hypothetical protein
MKHLFDVSIAGLLTTGRGKKQQRKVVEQMLKIVAETPDAAIAAARRRNPNLYVDRFRVEPVMRVDAVALRG